MADLDVAGLNAMANDNKWQHARIQSMANLDAMQDGPEQGGVVPVVELLKRVDETVKTMADGFVAEIQIEPAQFEELATKVRTGLATEIVNAIVERLQNG